MRCVLTEIQKTIESRGRRHAVERALQLPIVAPIPPTCQVARRICARRGRVEFARHEFDAYDAGNDTACTSRLSVIVAEITLPELKNHKNQPLLAGVVATVTLTVGLV